MDFNQVRYFLALADTLNFTRVAEQCYVSQPALTQAIKRLEGDLGGDLIKRGGRFAELTDLGKSLRKDFEDINRIRLLAKKTSKDIVFCEVAELNIGVMFTIGPQLLAGMLNSFQMSYPMLSVVLHDVTPSSITDLLLTGSLDAVFCAQHGVSHAHPRLRYMSLFEEPMVVAFPPDHAFTQYDEVVLTEIIKQPYIESLHCEFRQETHDFSTQQGLELDVVFRSEREDWIQSLVFDGGGVSMIPLYSLLDSKLSYRPIVEPSLSRKVELAIMNNEVVSPALERLKKSASGYDWSQLVPAKS